MPSWLIGAALQVALGLGLVVLFFCVWWVLGCFGPFVLCATCLVTPS